MYHLSPVFKVAKRRVVIIGNQAFYQSTGINSGFKDTWFPFLGYSGSGHFYKPGESPAQYQSTGFESAKYLFFKQQVLIDDGNDLGYIPRPLIGSKKLNMLVHRRFGSVNNMLISRRIGGGELWGSQKYAWLRELVDFYFKEELAKMPAYSIDTFKEISTDEVDMPTEQLNSYLKARGVEKFHPKTLYAVSPVLSLCRKTDVPPIPSASVIQPLRARGC